MSTNVDPVAYPIALAQEISGHLKGLRDLARKIDAEIKQFVALGGSTVSMLQTSRIDKEALKTAKVLLRCHATIDDALGGWKERAKAEQAKRKVWLANHKPMAGSLATRSYPFLQLLACSPYLGVHELGRLGIASSVFGRRYVGAGDNTHGRQPGLNLVEEAIRRRYSAISEGVLDLPPHQSAWKLLLCSTESSFKKQDVQNGVLGKGVYSHLRHAILPRGVTSISSKAFYFKNGIISLLMPDTLTSIGDSAFYGCTSFSVLALPDSVQSIGKCTFYECSALTKVTIPDSVTSIGEAAFGDCTGLVSVTLSNSMTSIADATFRECARLTEIKLPVGLTSIGKEAFYWCCKLTSITLPDSVTTIGASAFKRCSSLTSLTLPAGLTSVGKDAFKGCKSLGPAPLAQLKALEKFTPRRRGRLYTM